MKDLRHFKAFVKEINQENGRLYKQSVLEAYKGDFIVEQFLQLVYDPFIQFGLGKKKLTKQVYECEEALDFGSLDLLYYLQRHNTGTDYNIAHAKTVLRRFSEIDPEAADLLQAIICKNLSLGVDAKTINKVMGSLIQTFSVMLANKYFDKPSYVEGKTFTITEKLDGCRIIAIKRNDEVKFYTRAGQEYTGLVDLEQELLEAFPDNIALDGEITVLNYDSMKSKDAYKATTKIVRTDGDKHGVCMRVFDYLSADEWYNQSCDKDYLNRRIALEALADAADHEFKFFKILPVLYLGTDTRQITKFLDEAVDKEQEGIMINITNAKYEWKRTNNLLKVKKMQTLDLEVIGFEEGEGRLAGTLGAILVRYKEGNIVKVGSGFSDQLRKEIWQNRYSHLGTICEIQYFEETTNADGGKSLRFPIFKDFRHDKIEADY